MQRGSVSPLIKKHLAPFSLHPSRCYCELILQSYFAICFKHLFNTKNYRYQYVCSKKVWILSVCF